ncbi:hypothetical protein BDZ45DRAFT_502572 [Acephala macrosclerotiorum]|nr:hypothetical protein BDZ45DRAFT_502572 [Acephala macrosclerotiorum]
MPVFDDDDPFWFDRTIVPLWYQFTLLLALTCPLLYLTHLLPFHPYLPFKPKSYRTFLALLTAFANLSLYTEPYNLARPVYVCFYPVKGETFHHPEEKRLRVQYELFFGAWGLAMFVFVSRVGERVWVEWRRMEGSDGVDALRRQEREWMGGKEKRCRDVLMGCAWCLTVGAWLVMYGHSKKGKFGDWVHS